ncbi:MAG: flagellar hook-basal body protein [Peptostreptococcaceae bacterium]|nr:flagellar hook-basal body protein [Peptostreptococcaceae bacterium]
MNLSFYTGAVGAMSQQDKLDIIANNIANINTDGYKSKSSTFSNLIYSNMNAAKNANTKLKTGVGVKIEKTDMDMSGGALRTTDSPWDFAIVGDGLFALKAPNGNEISYTRDGSFILSKQSDDKFMLATKDGYLVLGKDNQPIEIKQDIQDPEKVEGKEELEQELEQKIAIYQFDNYNDMQSLGGNRVMPVAKNGTPKLVEVGLQRGATETSNVDFAKEVSKMIETQRAYQFALRMVTTSDEVEGIINSLRG